MKYTTLDQKNRPKKGVQVRTHLAIGNLVYELDEVFVISSEARKLSNEISSQDLALRSR